MIRSLLLAGGVAVFAGPVAQATPLSLLSDLGGTDGAAVPTIRFMVELVGGPDPIRHDALDAPRVALLSPSEDDACDIGVIRNTWAAPSGEAAAEPPVERVRDVTRIATPKGSGLDDSRDGTSVYSVALASYVWLLPAPTQSGDPMVGQRVQDHNRDRGADGVTASTRGQGPDDCLSPFDDGLFADAGFPRLAALAATGPASGAVLPPVPRTFLFSGSGLRANGGATATGPAAPTGPSDGPDRDRPAIAAPSPVPLPPGVWLMLAAILGLVTLRRMGHRRGRPA